MYDATFTERLNLKLVDFSGDYGNACLKMTIEIAKKDKDGTRSSNIFRSTYNSTRYKKSIPVESLSLYPNWYLSLSCKSKKDNSILSPLRDNIMILPKQIYKLVEMLTMMKKILTTKDDLFIATSELYLQVNPKYSGAALLYQFGLPTSQDNLRAEPAPYCEFEGARETPAFLLTLNGDYSISFYMTLEDIKGVLYLLSKTDFMTMALQITSTLGVSNGNVKTISRKSSALWGIEIDEMRPTQTVTNGEGTNMVKKLKEEKNGNKGVKVLWD